MRAWKNWNTDSAFTRMMSGVSWYVDFRGKPLIFNQMPSVRSSIASQRAQVDQSNQ